MKTVYEIEPGQLISTVEIDYQMNRTTGRVSRAELVDMAKLANCLREELRIAHDRIKTLEAELMK